MPSPKAPELDARPRVWFDQKTVPESTVPWYKNDIGPRLKPATRALYRDYSGLKDDEIFDHLHTIRQRAWPMGEYPCIGEWLFLLPSISAFPNYHVILSRVKDSATVLDLGCSMGQDLRRLTADGAPSENMYASDLHPQLWDIGYDLFRDRDTMKAHFIEADIFDSNSPLQTLHGKIDIIIACQFLHLFSWKGQLDALKKVVEMSRPGACLIGYQIGRENPLEVQRPWGVMYYHDVDSFNKLWREVARETDTNWKLEAELVSLTQWGMEKEDFEWMSADSRGLNFVVTRSGGRIEDSHL